MPRPPSPALYSRLMALQGMAQAAAPLSTGTKNYTTRLEQDSNQSSSVRKP